MRVTLALVLTLLASACGPSDVGVSIQRPGTPATWPLRGTPAPDNESTSPRPIVVSTTTDVR